MSSKTTQPPSSKRFTSMETGKLSPLGCVTLGLVFLALIITLFVITGLIFTLAFNIISPIFNGPTVDLAQGLVMWFLVCLVGSAFRKAT